MADRAYWGICLARTDPDVPQHRGIGYFFVDMRSPGIEVRPLREVTGKALFNEVLLDVVVVPDDCLVGGPGDGWRLARTTLAHERVVELLRPADVRADPLATTVDPRARRCGSC